MNIIKNVQSEVAVDHFKLKLMFSKERTKNTTVDGLDWTKGKSQDRALVTSEELQDYGYIVNRFSIKITDESL